MAAKYWAESDQKLYEQELEEKELEKEVAREDRREKVRGTVGWLFGRGDGDGDGRETKERGRSREKEKEKEKKRENEKEKKRRHRKHRSDMSGSRGKRDSWERLVINTEDTEGRVGDREEYMMSGGRDGGGSGGGGGLRGTFIGSTGFRRYVEDGFDDIYDY